MGAMNRMRHLGTMFVSLSLAALSMAAGDRPGQPAGPAFPGGPVPGIRSAHQLLAISYWTRHPWCSPLVRPFRGIVADSPWSVLPDWRTVRVAGRCRRMAACSPVPAPATTARCPAWASTSPTRSSGWPPHRMVAATGSSLRTVASSPSRRPLPRWCQLRAPQLTDRRHGGGRS